MASNKKENIKYSTYFKYKLCIDKYIYEYFSNLLRKLNIRHLQFHALRHSYATRLKENKVDIKIISELLGHSDWKITESIYVHATFEHKKKSVKELEINWSRKSS